MNLTELAPGRNLPDDFNVIIGKSRMNADPIKYEVDKETGAMFVDRFMSTAMHYPCNYGYIPHDAVGATAIRSTSSCSARCRSSAAWWCAAGRSAMLRLKG